MSDQDYKKLTSKYKKALQNLSDHVIVYLWALDKELEKTDISNELGKRLAKLSNQLDMANDKARYHELGVDFRKDDKDKYVDKLLAKARNPGRE